MKNSDVIIVGAGPVGLCLARSLSMQGLSVVIIEKQSLESISQPVEDGRDIAITHLSKDILNHLGIWYKIPKESISEIREARIFSGDLINYMEMSADTADNMAFIIPNKLIRKAVYDVVAGDKKITILNNVAVDKIDLSDEKAIVTLADGSEISAKLLVAADSRFSEIRKKAGITAQTKDFGKVMVVCQVGHDFAHEYIANECFLYERTLAVLPLVANENNSNRSSVILTLKPDEAKRVTAMTVEEFNQFASELFDYRLGVMRLENERHSYPLVAVYADRFVGERLALVGDAAVGMHPVTAHGFNFGLKGQKTLASLIKNAVQCGEDIGSSELLSRYEKIHRRATKPLYLATNGIVKLYTNDSKTAKVARTILLKTANQMLPIKKMIMSKLVEKDGKISDLPLPLRLGKKILERF